MIQTSPNKLPFRSGFIAVVGRPNVGKSTLMNTILKQKVAAISPRPQTTRRRQLGILTQETTQIIFIDTPGLHKPKHKLGEKMVRQAVEALNDCDIVLFIVDASTPPQEEDRILADQIINLGRTPSTLLLLNKVDLLIPGKWEDRRQAFLELLPEVETLEVSALSGKSIDFLISMLVQRLPEGPEYFPPEQVTDHFERDIAADLMRAAALQHLRDEVPHGIAVRIDQFIERGATGAYIRATLFVERESHKPIVIGHQGAMLKKIGSSARQEIEAMSGRKVFLELRVKVRKDWRDDEKTLKLLGFEDDDR